MVDTIRRPSRKKMKFSLDHLPENKQRDLKIIVDILLDKFEEVTGNAIANLVCNGCKC